MSSTSNPPRPVSSRSIPSPTTRPLDPYEPDTNVVPLTTYFTYKSSCLNRWVLGYDRSAVHSQNPESPDAIASDPGWKACQPFGYQQYYSPGICPVAYTMASLVGYEYYASTGSMSEWFGICCSSGLGYDSGSCVGTPTTPVTAWVPNGTVLFPYVTLTSTISSGASVTTSTYSMITTEITTLTRAVASADGLRVFWKQEDLSKFPAEYAISIAKQMGVSFTPSSSSMGVSSTSSSSKTKGLSTGTRTGIGIGVGVAALLALLLAVYPILRRQRRTKSTQSISPDVAGASTAEMEDQDATLATRKWYLGGRWRSEAEVKENKHPGELDSRSVRVVGGPPVELDGSAVYEGRI